MDAQKQLRVLLIDDVRDLPATFVARTYEEGRWQLLNAQWDVLLIDHDLGGVKTGYDIAKLIEELPHLRPAQVTIVSSSPVGVRNIAAALEGIYRKVSPDGRTFTLPLRK